MRAQFPRRGAVTVAAMSAWLVATHSGITLGPLLGRLMADEIVRDKPSSTLAPFRPDRFAHTAGSAR